ncbi:MAG: hypothetical protein RB191_16075 [Terriglobia bacterium]|nr:hypothetical protein [Terriglobia bacterium]
MRRSSPARAQSSTGASQSMLVPSFYIEGEEEDQVQASPSSRLADRRVEHALSLGNGGYRTVAHSLSDDY